MVNKRYYELAVWIAAGYALIGWGFSMNKTTTYHTPVMYDLAFPVRAGIMLRAGVDPYTATLFPDPRTTNHDPLYYPMPAVLVTMALGYVYGPLGSGIWAGATALLLGVGIVRDRKPWRLLMFASPFAFINGVNGQWPMLLLGATMLPGLAGLWICKPTTGLALFLSKPSWAGLIGAGVLLAVSGVLLPAWPLEWIHNLTRTHHPIPIMYAPVLGLAVLRWRDPRARLLLLLSCVPVMDWWYDFLPLMLLSGGPLTLGLWAVWAWAMFVGNEVYNHQYMLYWNLAAGYLPAFVIVVVWPYASKLRLQARGYVRV